jgi:hypothetical protein
MDLYAVGHNSTSEVLLTFFGNGDGTFQAPIVTNVSAGNGIEGGVAFADFNKDGANDAVFINSNNIVVLFGSADGTFSPGVVSAVTDTNPRRVYAVADFRGAGDLSVVVSAFVPGSMQPLRWMVYDGSSGSFPPTGTTLEANFNGDIGVAVGAFNHDGRVDVAAVGQDGTFGVINRCAVLLNTGASGGLSTFAPTAYVPGVSSQASAKPPIPADFNGDGIIDLGIGSFIYLGKGDGTFPTLTGSTASFVFDVAGDFNGDGKADLLTRTPVTNPNTGTLSWVALGTLLQVAPGPDLSGVVTPNVVHPGLNNTSNVTVTLTPLFGFTNDVSVTGLPTGVTPTFTPATVTGGNGSSTLALAVNGSVALGTYPITVTGTGGGITHGSDLTLVVNASPGDFSGPITPDTQNITAGQSASFSVTII